MGIIKCAQPYYLQSKIIYERDRKHFHDEIKFNKLSRNNIDFATFMIDCLFSTRSLRLYSYTLDTKGKYFLSHFASNPWKAYEDITIRLLKAALPDNEILILIADYISAPDYVRFESCVKRNINESQNRLSIAGVCRFDSRSNDLLQLTDLFIGLVSYDLKISLGLIKNGDKYKRRLLEHFKNNIGVQEQNFMSGFKNYIFNIFVDKDLK